MDKGKIIFDVLNEYVYNDTNQAGDKLQIIDASDLTEIIPKIVENLGLFSVSGLFKGAKPLSGEDLKNMNEFCRQNTPKKPSGKFERK